MDGTHLGAPSIKIGELQVWAHSLESPDEDWLNVTAHCGASGASVWVNGSILTLSAIKHWVEGCQAIDRNLSGAAVLNGIEPELLVTMEVADRLGHLKVIVKISPDYLRQEHKFEFELDLSFLPDMIREGKMVLARFGMKVDAQ